MTDDWTTCNKGSSYKEYAGIAKTSLVLAHKYAPTTINAKDGSKTVENGVLIENTIKQKFKTLATKQDTFAQKLQQYLDSSARNTKPIKNNFVECNMELNTNKTTPKHNIGGNLELTANISCTNNQLPNYVSMILSNSQLLSKYTLLNILVSPFTSADLLASYYYDKNTTTTNGVPNWNISTLLSDPTKCFGWNVRRNYTAASANSMLNFHASKLNEFIHYIISNNITQATDAVRDKWVSIFGPKRALDTSVYAHVINTLLLPSLVNYFTSNKTKQNTDTSYTNTSENYDIQWSQAISYGGYVPVGAQFLPVAGGANRNDIVWFNEKSGIVTNPLVDARYNMCKLMTGSTNNHPLIAGNRSRSYVIDTPAAAEGINYMRDVTSKFTSEKYKWSDSEAAINKFTDFATRHVGQKKIVQHKVRKSKNGKRSFSVKLIDLPTTMSSASFQTGTSPGDGFWVTSEAWMLFVSDERYFVRNFYPSTKEFYIWYVEKTNTDKFKTWAINKIKSMEALESPQFTIDKIAYSNTNRGKTVTPQVTALLEESIAKSTVYYMDKCSGSYDGGTWHYEVEYTYNCGKSSGKTVQETWYKDFAYTTDTVTVTVDYTVSYLVLDDTYEYRGQFAASNASCVITGANLQDATPTKNPKTACLYKVNKEFLHFSDYSYLNWFFIATSLCGCDMAVKEIRKYVNECPDMILANKVYCKFADEVRKMGAGGDYFYYNIPISTMIVKIPDSKVIPYKFYTPGVNVIKPADIWKNTRDTLNGNNVNAFVRTNLVHEGCNNYLDLVMKGAIDGAFQRATYDNNTVFCVLLPTRGSQLFEVIDKSIVTLLPSSASVIRCKITDSKCVLYDTGLTKLVFSPIDFNTNNTTKVLLDSYKFIGSVNTPRMTVTKNNSTNCYVLNISAKTNGNSMCYIYISNDKTQEMIPLQDNKTVGTVVNKNINIAYNGIDANQTPTCLLKHFV